MGVKRARALSASQMEYAGGIGEAIRVAEETHVFGVEQAQRERIDEFVAKSKALFFSSQLVGRLTPNLYQSLMYVLLIAGLAVISLAGSGHAASLGAVVLLLVRAGTYGQQIQGSFQSLRQSLPFVERLQEATRRYEESAPTWGSEPVEGIQTVAFDDVSFAYREGRPVLRELSFEVLGGETIGVIGPSGAGKSTLIQLLLQLRVPTSGRYLVNGKRAGQISAADWHRLVAYVPQEPRLLHASVTENIRYFRDISPEDVERPRRHHRVARGLRHDRRPARRRDIGRPAAADVSRPRARRPPGGVDPRRAHERSRSALRAADPGVAERPQA
jgi:ABC-type multidrug transport system fused ATPase/permease subunit